MIYVYAIADRPEAPLPNQLGQHDELLTKVIWRDVVAVVSPFNGSQLSKTADELWRHEEVVEALMNDRAVVPVRFGTLLPSPQHVSDILCRAYGALIEDIERVRGQIEIGVRFLTAVENVAEPKRQPRAPVNSRPSTPIAAMVPRPRPTGSPCPKTDRARRIYGQGLSRERELRDRQRAKLTAGSGSL